MTYEAIARAIQTARKEELKKALVFATLEMLFTGIADEVVIQW